MLLKVSGIARFILFIFKIMHTSAAGSAGPVFIPFSQRQSKSDVAANQALKKLKQNNKVCNNILKYIHF